MFIFATFSTIFILTITSIYFKIFKKNEIDYSDDEICYTRHPMSDSESDSDDDECEEKCYMKDFYEEANLSDEWMAKTEEEKLEILDKELDDYKNKTSTIVEHLKNIKC